MSYEIRKIFESRHVFKYLGINKDQLHHWVKTKRLIKPAIEGIGRGRRNKFSFENLLCLALIKDLVRFGIELRTIEAIFAQIAYERSGLDEHFTAGDKGLVDIFSEMRREKAVSKGAEREEKDKTVLLIKSSEALDGDVYVSCGVGDDRELYRLDWEITSLKDLHQLGYPFTLDVRRCFIVIILDDYVDELEYIAEEKGRDFMDMD